MHWLFPGFLAGAAAVALPLLLHLMRRRPRRTVAFPSLRFLRLTAPQNERSQQLRRWLVLALRCAALLLLTAAFARPFMTSGALGERHATVVVIDNSFSLQAGHRWAALRDWAHQRIGQGRVGDTLGVLVMAPRPTWLAPVNTPRDTGLAQLDAVQPGWDTVRAESALRLAADALAGTNADLRELLVLTDHQQVTWAGFNFGKKLPAGITPIFPPVAEPLVRQAAIGLPTISRHGAAFHLHIPLRTFTGPQTRTLRVFRDGVLTPLVQQEVRFDAGENQAAEVDLPGDETVTTAYFRCALDPDDLPADDTSYGVWQSAGERSVLLDAAPGGSAADYLGTALASTADLKPSLRVAPLPTGTWPINAVAVLRNDRSFSGENAARLTVFLRAGGSALVFMTDGSAQASWLANTAGLHVLLLPKSDEGHDVRDWTMDHPLVAAVGAHRASALVGWNFRRGWALPVDTVEPLALWSADAAAIGEQNVGTGRLLICGFTPDRRDGDWPVRESFLPFAHRGVAYLLGAQFGVESKPFRVGQSIPLPPESGRWQAIEGPAARAATTTVNGAALPSAPGVYALTNGAERRLYAVNLAAEESDPTAWSPGAPWETLAAPPSAHAPNRERILASAAEAEERGGLWWWPVAGMAVFVLVELGLANQTSR